MFLKLKKTYGIKMKEYGFLKSLSIIGILKE
jgi:hypothetical protein